MATRTIGTEIVLSGEKAFNDAMKGVNSNLKNLRADMALTSAEFDGNADSMEALTAKQKVLQSSVDQHRAKVDALRAMYEEQVKKYGENSAAADKYRLQLTQATAALVKEEKALEKTGAALKAAEAENKSYIPVTQRMANAVKSAGDKVDKFAADIKEGAHHVPVLAEALDIAKVSATGLGVAMKATGSAIKLAGTGAKTAIGGIGTAAGGLAKGVGAITAASAAGVAAIGAGGVIALTTMANMAREAADAAKAANEAGETLTDSQKQWLAYSNQLDTLDASVANAKGALAGVLLPMLGDLSTEGAAFLNDFTRDMNAAAGDTGKQTQVLSDYIVKGATLIKEKLPEYIAAGKELFAGIGEGLSEHSDELLDMGLDLTMDLLDGIISNAPVLASAGISLIQKLTEGMIERGPDVLESAVQMVSQITTGLAQAAPSLIPAAVQLVMQLLTALISNAPLLLEAGLELILGIVAGILNGLGDIGNVADDVIDTFVDRMLSSDSKVLQLGGKVVDWIRDGIANAWDGLVSWFNGIWDRLFSNRNVNVNVNKSGGDVDGSHAGGLDYVPFDGYLARLHRGETVLTASEAAAYRKNKAGGQTVKQFNLTIHTQSLSKEELDMIVAYVNGKLGDDL